MPKTQPTLIKVGSKGAYVNLNSCVSLGIVDDQQHSKLRDDFEGDPSKAEAKDYLQYKTPTASFYFIGRDELMLRVGAEITQEEYDNIKAVIDEVVYVPKDARIAATD